MANKQYATVKNDYEMTLNFNSEVDEVPDDGTTVKLPTVKYNFIKIDELGPYVNARRLIGMFLTSNSCFWVFPVHWCPCWVLKDVHLPVRLCRCDWGCSKRGTLDVHSAKDNQRGDTQA